MKDGLKNKVFQELVKDAAACTRCPAMCEAHDLDLKRSAAQIHSWNERVLVPIYHPSPQVLASHRREAEQLQDYQVVANAVTQIDADLIND